MPSGPCSLHSRGGSLPLARRWLASLAGGRLRRSSRLYYDECSVVRPERGNNSVVECDLAKVEVAGSNPVSRSNLRSLASAEVVHRSSLRILASGGGHRRIELRLASQLPLVNSREGGV